MNEPWSILSTRYCSDIKSPTSEQIVAAVDELSDPAHADDQEHSEICLRHGYDEGPMYIVGYTTSQYMYFEQWKDQDFETEIAPRVMQKEIPPSEAIRVLQQLCDGDIDLVKRGEWI